VVVALGSTAANGRVRETERWGRRDGVGRFFFLREAARWSGKPRPNGRGQTNTRVGVFLIGQCCTTIETRAMKKILRKKENN
jgi:hypothetical protein